MAVVVNSLKLQGKLAALRRELPRTASRALVDSARTTIDVTQNAARADWAAGSEQVGFDVEQFNRTIDQIETLPQGGFGVLNTNRMGTEADYEQIAGIRGLWHMGRHQGKRFGTFIADSGNRADLEQLRQAVWGNKQPQWFLLNDGNMYPGAFDPRPGTHTIERVAFDMVTEVRRIVSDRVTNLIRTIRV